jgi:RNA polymerase sigma factor (sigma-70 family)
MPAEPMTGVINELRRAVMLRDSAATDSQLVTGFVGREDGAFEALLQRHGRMVLGVCRRVLGNSHDADDAFQASFLVFVRKAASLRQPERLANWLYGVAYRTALEAKAARARRRAKETAMRNVPHVNHAVDDPWRELHPLLDHELSRLPDKYRVPIVLCDLEGKTRKDAARQLGWPEGTLSGRLARARTLLAKRMARHGLGLSAGAMAAALTRQTASAEVPRSLAVSTVKAVAAVSAGPMAAAVSAHVAALTQGVLTAMLLSKLKIVSAGLVLIAVACLFAIQVPGRPHEAGAAAFAGRPAASSQAAAPGAQPQGEPAAKKNARIYLHASLKVKRAGDDEPRDIRGIIAIDPETGKWRKITGNGHNPRISPDGETVIFVRHTGGANGFVDSETWNCDTGGSDNPGKITDIGGMPLWSPDGKHLIVSKSKIDNKDVWDHRTFRIDANGANAKELPIPKTDEVDDWSRDGKWLVTVSDRHPPHGHGYQLYVMHPDGTDERRLTKGGLNCYPRFSPDSRKIVYIRQTAKEGNSVWVVNVDGTDNHEVLKEESLVSPNFACWSPDGKRLAVIRFKWEQGADGVRRGITDADFHLEIMDANGQNRRRLELADATVQWLGHGDWR